MNFFKYIIIYIQKIISASLFGMRTYFCIRFYEIINIFNIIFNFNFIGIIRLLLL